ncbi:methyltransferase [Streptomyces olivaceiscleroticus]|uniref:Methyltransferase n=1 Tax=Streptomyces olivaceiscleroticus TaxID=68245 RepID=A0ABP3KLF4_9ACTN
MGEDTSEHLGEGPGVPVGGASRSVGELADLVTPMAIRTAATLRLADRVADGIRTADALADATGSDPGALERLLDHLVTVGLFRRACEASSEYELTAAGAELRDGHPDGLRRRLDTGTAIGRADLAFVELSHSVRTGAAAFPERYGQDFWSDLRADQVRTADYDAQMAVDVTAWAEAVQPVYDWAGLGRLVDVGGGSGTMLAALLKAHPDLRGTVFDQPETARAARSTLAAAGVADRGDAVSGDFFGELPSGAGGYLLCAVLHDWDDESAVAILRSCARAAGRTGKVLVVEKFGAGGEAVNTAMDLRMLVYFGGRERGVTDLTVLAARAGLTVREVHPADRLAVVELTPS